MDDKYESIYRNLNVTPTKQRVDLAQLIFSKKQHFTANDLIAMADKKKLHISMATIYNTLSLLEEKGMLKTCLLYTSPSPRDLYRSRMPSSA